MRATMRIAANAIGVGRVSTRAERPIRRDVSLFASTGIALLLLCALASYAQEPAPVAPKLSASLSPQDIPFHRTATYTLRIETGPDDNITFPDLASVEPDLTIRKGEVRETRNETAAIIEQEYIVDAIRPGVYFLPAQQMRIDGAETLSVPALALSVRDLTEDELALAQEFGELPLPAALADESTVPAWAWAALGAFVLALAAGLYWLWSRKRHAPAPPPVPAWEAALRRLKELESRKLPAKGRYETFYVDLSSILRYYIEDRFHIRAPEQTTPEFLESAQSSGALSADQQEVLSKLLRHCDRVKFARYEPAMDEMDDSLEVVRRFVEETIPRPEPETTTKEKAA
jgi:hypothetical protein